MRIGPLRHLVEVQAEQRTPDGRGGFDIKWKRVGQKRWARIAPMRGNEALLFRQLQISLTHNITMRYHPDISAAQRLLFGSRVFNIREVVNVEERNIQLELRCEEGVAV